MHQVTIEEASARLPELFEQAGQGEEVIIQGNGLAMRLTPVAPPKRRPQLGTATGQVWMAPDFDATPEDFKDYM